MPDPMIRRLRGKLRSGRKEAKPSGRVVRDINGFRMHLDLDDKGISRKLYENGERERGFMYLLEHAIVPGGVALDIGGNLGYATLHMCRRVGPSGFVYAIEPDEHNLGLLRANIAENGYESRCEISRGLISDRTGPRSFWRSKRSNLGSVEKLPHSREETTLQAYSLTDFLRDRRPIDFMKMDAEGHEVEILQGGIEYFRKDSRPCSILFETHGELYREHGKDFEPVLRDYIACGFHARYMLSTPVPDPPLFRDAGYRPIEVFHTDRRKRGLYENVSDNDMIRFVQYGEPGSGRTGRVRAMMLSRV